MSLNTKGTQEQSNRPLKNSFQNPYHTPVLLQEVLELLPFEKGFTVIDATLGLGGHSLEILKKIGPSGHLIGFDWDKRNRCLAQKNLSDFSNVTIIPKGFSELLLQCQKRGITGVNAILFDLGISSMHLDDATRGFSYRLDGPLDMRMDESKKESAADLIQNLSEAELADIFFFYGEEK